MKRLGILTGVAVIGLSAACGPAGPSSVPGSQGPLANATAQATGVWAPDVAAVTEGIVAELRALGLEAIVAERFGGASFSVGMQRVALPSIPTNGIYLYVYRTAALAADEASRIGPDGNVRPVEGPPRVHADYIQRQQFHYRDRVIAQHSGCDATVASVMQTLFASPVVVTGGGCH
jgi:hypothetical protein